ncbi:MAG: TauD/TfdA family dioxygenase [Acidobacteria bacterium]|nr:TauD/TfdA family dioxygenase [Acidobacteriota bacterium]
MSTPSAIQENTTERIAILDTREPDAVREALKEHGAIVIRAGGAVSDFEELSNELITPMVHHSTSTTVERDVVNRDGTTSTVNKGMDYIPLHREGSYAPGCPDLLMLYCVKPADMNGPDDTGGQTTLCDGVELLNALSPKVRKFVEDAILRWSWSAPPERWMAALGAGTQDAAIERLNLLNGRLAPWEQLEAKFEGDTLHGVFQTLCVIPTKWGNRRSFCNSLLIYHYRQATDFYPKHMYVPTMGDGQPFPADMLEEISNLANERTHSTHWRAKDILIFDNSRYMHGRTGFTDTSRQIFVRMGYVKRES